MNGMCLLGFLYSGIMLIVGGVFFFVGKSGNHYTGQVKGKITGLCINSTDFNAGGSGQQYFAQNDGSGVQAYQAAQGTRAQNGKTRCLVYTYEVNNVTYHRATSVAYDTGSAQKKVGQEKLVRYNEANPSESTISSAKVYKIVSGILLPLGSIGLILTIILMKVL